MLSSQPTKYGAGITLAGDYADLADLHETIHYLASETGPLPPHHDEFALGLAYDVRKAYEGERRTGPTATPHGSADYYAVDILWPAFLVQVAMLRTTAGYLPTNRTHQANLYRLEACAESALLQMDLAVGSICMRWLAQYAPLPDNFLLEFVSQQTREFVFGATAGKARFRRLPTILDDISTFSPKYKDFERFMSEQAAKQNARPQDLWDFSEWPDFRW